MTYKYLFFPFTHIKENDLETILTFFPKFHCLSLIRDFKEGKNENNSKLKQLFETDIIIPYFLSSAILDSVEDKFEQYLEWAKIHKGNEHNLKLLLKDNPYFTNDSDVTTIKSQIKGYEKGQQDTSSDYSKLQKDLLFLKMAQLYDEQNEGVDLVLKQINQLNIEVVADLRGTTNFKEQIQNFNKEDYSDPGIIMIQERISAWFRCINEINIFNNQSEPYLFITTNEEIFNYFESNCKDVVNILDIENIKVHENRCENGEVWQGQFGKFLMEVQEKIGKKDNHENNLPEVLDRCSKRGRIKVCNFFMGDINHILHVEGKHISVCLIKIK